jgi:LPS sulfotransferase NodH
MENFNKYDQYLSEQRDFADSAHKARTRYIICSSPRTGSTLLGQMLKDSNCAGDPLEYFNPQYLLALRKRFEISGKLSEIVRLLEKHRTSSNGVFGIQIHWSHFSKIFQHNPNERDLFFENFDKIIVIRRKDKIAQAISLYRASTTKLWSSLDEDRTRASYHKDDEDFDPEALSQLLHYVIHQDEAWLNYLKTKNKLCKTLFYEDIVQDWNSSSREVLNFITPYTRDIPAMGIRQQRPEVDILKEKFRRYLGI